MICVTGGEGTIAKLTRRLEAQTKAALQEVRLDLLRPFDEAVYPLLRSPRIIATCRGTREGGGFSGSIAEQGQILRRALKQQPGYLDLDLSLPHQLRRELFEGRGATRVILSHHDFQPGGAARISRLGLEGEPADLLKLAVTVEDTAELQPLLSALPAEPRPILRIGMGDPGLISRVLYTRFGSPWTFAVVDEASRIAPGQLTLERAWRWRVTQTQNLTPLALVGGAQVMASPGPMIYNKLFRRSSLPWIYVPVVTTRPEATLDLLRSLGFGGCSVTMPAKESLARQVDQLRSPADTLGVINTILLAPSRGPQVGLNTDAPAIQTLLQPHAGKQALVLGCGGAARAAIFALQLLGCPVAVACRNQDQARALQTEIKIEIIPWSQRYDQEADILINATPLGGDGVADPLVQRTDWDDCVVLDMVLSPTPTPLLQRAAQAGAQVISGLSMWFIQGALQMEALTGHPVTAQELNRIYHE